jgi:hypothetical protein
MMGGPTDGLLGLSWRWYARDSGRVFGACEENEREATGLATRNLRISAPIGRPKTGVSILVRREMI